MNPEDRPFSVNSVSDVGIDVTDEDLKKLADSFAKGREELQKVNRVNLIFLYKLSIKELLFIRKLTPYYLICQLNQSHHYQKHYNLKESL